MLSPTVDALVRKFADADAVVGVIGLGYVGLPVAKAFSDRGFEVYGFDIDEAKPERLRRGEPYIKHVSIEGIPERMRQGRFHATTDFSLVSRVDALIICVPTPLTRHREPDLSAIEQTARTITPHLRPNQLVILESTTYPGTTRDVLLPILAGSGLRPGEELFVAFSPEREDPGNAHFSTTTIPKVVGADDPASLALAIALYGAVIDRVVPVQSLATAEAVKLTENIFRAVNIAMANELKVIYSAMGIDVWEVIEAATTKPFGYMPFYPGPGLGGHCIPIDPFYLTWKAREFGLTTRFIELAGEINTGMPRYVVDRLAAELNDRFRKSLNGARVLIIGLAYKKNIDDVRESPAFALLKLLEDRGAAVEFHDPHVEVVPTTREHLDLAGRRSIDLTAEALSSMDAVLICTDHDDVDYGLIVRSAPLVVDTRNAVARAGLAGAPNVATA